MQKTCTRCEQEERKAAMRKYIADTFKDDMIKNINGISDADCIKLINQGITSNHITTIINEEDE